jgi:hypothetical protein
VNPAEARVVDSSRYPPYAYPNVAVAPIAGLVAFGDERVDTFLDGVPVTRPRTKFHGEEGS